MPGDGAACGFWPCRGVGGYPSVAVRAMDRAAAPLPRTYSGQRWRIRTHAGVFAQVRPCGRSGPAGCRTVGAARQGSTETGNETRASGRSAAGEHDPRASLQVSMAEDARFELARANTLPTMLTTVHRGSPPSVTCPNMTGAVAGERRRTQMSETETETECGAALYAVARLRSGAP